MTISSPYQSHPKVRMHRPHKIRGARVFSGPCFNLTRLGHLRVKHYLKKSQHLGISFLVTGLSKPSSKTLRKKLLDKLYKWTIKLWTEKNWAKCLATLNSVTFVVPLISVPMTTPNGIVTAKFLSKVQF